MAMSISSAAFRHEGDIPSRHTCDGLDLSPPLTFHDVPAAAKSLVVICDDPDAPAGVWDHWVLFNLPPTATGLPEGQPDGGKSPDGHRAGKNSWGRLGYGGPCPPGGTHRYFFTLYALDTVLDVPEGADKQQVLQAAKGHILASATIMGRYARGR